MKEIWKDYKGNIKELYGLLKVSNLGRVYKIGGGLEIFFALIF